MATYTWPSAQFPNCPQQAIDFIRNNPAPGGDTLNFDPSGFPDGGPIKASDSPCGRGGETPPTFDGSNCTGYGGSVLNFDGIRNLTVNGNGLRIVGSNTGNWVVGIHDTQNLTLNDLVFRGINNVNQDANGVIFATVQSGSWNDGSGNTVQFTGIGNHTITLNNVVTEASPHHIGGIQSFNSSDGWYIYDSRFTGIPGLDAAGAYSRNGGSQISFYGPGQRVTGGPNEFIFCDLETDCLEQWGNSTGIPAGQNIITDGNAIIFETGSYTGEISISNLYAHDISADIFNLFSLSNSQVNICHVTAHDFGYYVRQNSPDNFSPPPRNGQGQFVSNFNFGNGGASVNVCDIVSDRGGDGSTNFTGAMDGGGTVGNVYLIGGYGGWGPLGTPSGTAVLNGSAIPGGYTSPSDNTLCTTSSCPGCSNNDCNTGADICGRAFECGEMGAFSTSDVIIIDDCEPFAFNPNTGTRTLCAGEPGNVTINVVPALPLVWTATGPAGWVINPGATTTITAPAAGSGTVVITGDCDGDTQQFTVEVTVIDCDPDPEVCTPTNLGDICNDRPTTFGVGTNCTILSSDGPAVPIISGSNIIINPTGELGEFFVTYACLIDGETVNCFATADIVACDTGPQDCVLKGCAG